MRRTFLLWALLAAAAPAQAAAPEPVCSEPVEAVLFISPMGEPFRPKGAGDEPARRWFDQADRDGDGRLTVAEMTRDADRFFGLIDKDGNGELLPDEVHAYEQDVAPEIRLYQHRARPVAGAKSDRDDKQTRQRKRRRQAAAEGAIGAGRFAFLNIPNPVASADDDINRAISLAEFRAAAATRFRALDPAGGGALTFAILPRTPVQTAANAACVERVREAGRTR